ncbi:MAG: M23 family metallopeptidase [Xanthobacteraceae bacterium]
MLLLTTGAAAQEIKAPQISYLTMEWDAALAALGDSEAVRRLPPLPAGAIASATPNLDLLTRLNLATGKVLPHIAASPVPVLLPLNLDTLSRGESAEFVSDFGAPKFFLAGPAGYDAAFTTAAPTASKRLKKGPPRDVEIHVSGFALLYDLGKRAGGEEKPPTGLQADFPDIRRFYFEGHMRYLFERHGVLYGVSIECFDGRSNSKRFHCNDAHGIAVRFLKALTITGGMPQPAGRAPGDPSAGRPDVISTAFTYYPPGEIISGTGARKQGGHSDYTIYSKIRFPLAEAPTQTYSQVYMNLGDCTGSTADFQMKQRKGAPFRCPFGKKVAAAEMPSGGYNGYPWRDNFCEVRGFFVGQCPAGIGHQGQDIVPVDCRLSSRDWDRCDRKEHPLVAVRDGVVLRSPGQEGFLIVTNVVGEHLRFRYLHMNPKLIDADGFVSGRVVREGDTIGRVGNYAGREGGTSYHLHFDMQVPTKDGWVLVNPYMTLVLAYERLIGARGTQLPRQTKEAPAIETSSGTRASIAEERTPSPTKKKTRSRSR